MIFDHNKKTESQWKIFHGLVTPIYLILVRPSSNDNTGYYGTGFLEEQQNLWKKNRKCGPPPQRIWIFSHCFPPPNDLISQSRGLNYSVATYLEMRSRNWISSTLHLHLVLVALRSLWEWNSIQWLIGSFSNISLSHRISSLTLLEVWRGSGQLSSMTLLSPCSDNYINGISAYRLKHNVLNNYVQEDFLHSDSNNNNKKYSFDNNHHE